MPETVMYSSVALTSILSFCIPGTSNDIVYLSPLSTISHNGIRVSIKSLLRDIPKVFKGFVKGVKKHLLYLV
jgi:hypothetical protein